MDTTSKAPLRYFCRHCKEPCSGRRTAFCSEPCRAAWEREHYKLEGSAPSKDMELPVGTVGAMAEVLAWYHLMKQGWDVYRAISPASKADAMAYRNGHKIRVEIRTGYYRVTKQGERKLYYPKSTRDATSKDYYAIVIHDLEEVIFIPPLP